MSPETESGPEERPAKKASQKSPLPQQSTARKREQLFPIVGVGASAGGLEAFTAFLKQLPSDSGMAFVLIQHLAPKQHSQLSEILSKATKMPVREIASNTTPEPDCVYVMAPGVCLCMNDGQIEVDERGPGRNLPIDYFLKSLASDNTSKAIGIVLSGTASDGTVGLKAVKAEGGITFAQEPASAKFDGMPRSAIAAGVVDFVLPPGEIAKRLVRLVQHPYVTRKSHEDSEAAQEMNTALNRIFHVLRTVTGNDFTHYKHSTLRRRIHRRMVLHADEDLSDYLAYLLENAAEARALADDLLICVTSFFREPEYFAALADRVFPELLESRSPEQSIRIWVPGCATGEEAYSLAICLTEFLEKSGTNAPIQIFATDISEKAIEKARAGIYPAPALDGVSPAQLKRFFVKTNGGYQIAKSIRESCIFAKQNVAKDPPFHSLDLISCCNALIYFAPVLQRKVLATFHYALKSGGFLMLGPSESVGPLADAFSPLDKRLRLYSKRPWAHPLDALFARGELPAAQPQGNETAAGVSRPALNAQKTAERLLLAQYAPAGVIVDDAMNIVHVRGDIAPYLQIAPGEPTYNLLKMAREGMVVLLRTAILKAKRQKAAIVQQARVNQSGQLRDVNLRVTPLDGIHFLILFENSAPAIAPVVAQTLDKKTKAATARGSRETARLKEELNATREYLQSIIEEQEASTEELKSANEEAQASNEELETSKEELQSANEELNTLNDELKVRNAALDEVNVDLTNLLNSIDVPLIMVGKDLRIRRFTPTIEPMLNLIDSDVGRPISDFRPNIDTGDLRELLLQARSGESPAAREIQDAKGCWYSLQALPYKTPDNKTDGALLVLLDIDAVRRSRDFAEAIVETVQQPLVILAQDLTVRSVNRAFLETFHVSREETAGRFLYDLGNRQWDIPPLREALEKILPEKGELHDFEVDQKFEFIGRKIMLLNAREIRRATPFGGPTILLAIADITERKGSEEQIRIANEDLKQFAYAASHDLQEPLRMMTNYSQLLSRRYKDKLDERAGQFLDFIADGAQRAEALLHAMRGYWTASDHGEHLRTAVDCNEVLQAALSNLRQAIVESGAMVIHDPLPIVWAEEVLLVELFQNLIGNAIKYRSDEPPKVYISAGKNDKGDWVLSVKDNGIGIDPEYATKIFEIFSRMKGGMNSGSGMGLAISRKIVERLHGRIWVESEEGHGADFKFMIPAGH